MGKDVNVTWKFKCPECGKRYNVYMDATKASKVNKKFYSRSVPCEDCCTLIFRRKKR